jgi:hypothetical protein
MTARSLLLVLAMTTCLAIIGTVVYHRPYWRAAPILPAEEEPEAMKYAQEFAAALTIRANDPSEIQFEGGSATSPDGRLKLQTRTLRNYYHEIMISSGLATAPVTVLILQEADPGSGTSHDWRWSRDSKAVFIYGSGELAGRAWSSEFMIIYLVDRRALYSVNLRPFLLKRMQDAIEGTRSVH